MGRCSIRSESKETSFKNLHSTSGETVTFEALWIDDIKPVASIESTTSDLKTKTQTATLKCTDEVWVTAYYFGATSNPEDNLYTAVTSTTSLNVTESVNAGWTYYLYCKDAAWNVSNASTQVYYEYTVYNMEENATGTTSNYNTNNYTQAGR